MKKEIKMKHSPLMRITSAFVAALMAVCPFSMGGNLPVGPNVTHGNVGISSNGTAMQIDQLSGQAIVNWESFGIGAGHSVNVSQPDANAAMLSRVIGSDPSAIFGSLTANGTFYLVNPNGVTFGPNASVDVHSLIASTLDISDEDFLAGKLAFSGDSDAVITNSGALSAMETIALLAREVRNAGSIAAANVGIAAGQSVVIDEIAGGKIKLKLDRLASSNDALASLDAGSLISSNGGDIIILSDNDTLFNAGAAIDAGSGFVEVSGDDYVRFAGALTAGSALIDPTDLDQDADVILPGDVSLTATGNVNIAAGVTVQSTGGNVSITADDNDNGNGGVIAGPGSVIDAAVDLTITGVDVDLTDATVTALKIIIEADDKIDVAALSATSDITATANSGSLQFDSVSTSGNVVLTGVGVSERTQPNRTSSGVQGESIIINGGAGDVTIGSVQGGDVTISGAAVSASDVTANTTNGDIEVTATGLAQFASLNATDGAVDIDADGITVAGAISAAGNVDLNANSSDVNAGSVVGGGVIDLDGGAITITGDLTANGGNIDVSGGSIGASGNLIANGDVILVSAGTVEVQGSIDAQSAGHVSVVSLGDVDLGAVTAAGADGDGDGIGITGGEISTGLLTASTGNVDIAGSSASIDTGINSQGAVDIQTTGDITVPIIESTAGTITLASNVGGITIESGGHLLANAGNVVIAGTSTVDINGPITTTSFTVGPSATLTATGDVTLTGYAAIDVTSADLGKVSANGSLSGVGIGIAASDFVQLNGDLSTQGSSADIVITAGNDISSQHIGRTGLAITSDSSIVLDSTSGAINLPDFTLNADDDIVLTAATFVDIGPLKAGLDTSGNMEIGDNLTTNITIGDADAEGYIDILGNVVDTQAITARGIGGDDANSGLHIQAAESITANGDLVTENSDGNLIVGAANSVDIGSVNSAASVIVDAADSITSDGTITSTLIIRIGVTTPADVVMLDTLNAGIIQIFGGQITIDGDVTSTDTIDINATKLADDLTVYGNVTSNGGAITLVGTGQITLDDGSQVNSGAGAIHITAADDIFVNSLVTSNGTGGAVQVTSQTAGIYDNGDSHIDIQTPGTVTLIAVDHIGRVNAGDTLVNPAGSTPEAGDGNALDTQISTLIATTTAADAEIAIDNTGAALILGPGSNADLSPSPGAKGALWVRNDLDLTVANWQLDTDDDVGLISTTGNVTFPGGAETISGLEQELAVADIEIGVGTARLEAHHDVIATGGPGLSIIGGNLVLKSTNMGAIVTLLSGAADVTLDGPGVPIDLTQYNGASGFAANLNIADLDSDGNALVTSGGVIDVTLTNGYDFVTDNGTLTIVNDVSANNADITLTVGSGSGQDEGLLKIESTAQVATDTSGDKLGTLAINGHVSSAGQLLANSGETLTLTSVAGKITFTGPQAGAGNVTLNPGGNNEHNIIFTPEGRLEVNGGSLLIANVDTFGMQGSSRIDVHGGDVTVNDAHTVQMAPDTAIAATGNISIEAAQEITLGHLFSDTDGNGGDITVTNTHSNLRALGDITITGVMNPGGNDITLTTANGAISATGFGETVNTDLLSLTANGNIGSGASPIDADALRIDAASATGGVWLNNTPRAHATALEINANGTVFYSQQGNNLTITGAGITSAGGNVTIDPPADITVAATIDTAGGNLTIFNTGNFTQNTGIAITTGAGDTHIQSGGSVAIDSIVTADIVIIAGGTISETAADAGVDINSSATINLVADGNIGILQVDAGTRIDAASQGTVTLESAADFLLGHISGSDLTLTAAGSINDSNNGDLNLVSPNATLTAINGGITADTALATITATTTGGNISLDESDDITLTSLAADGGITVTSDGTVTADALTTDGSAIVIHAENSITVGTAIANGAGDVSLQAATGSVTTNATIAGAAIDLVAADTITVNSGITGSGDVTLDAGSIADVNAAISGTQLDITARGAGNAATIDGALSATAGDIVINTPNGAILANSTIAATGGGTRLSAESTITVAGVSGDTEVNLIADGAIITNDAVSGADVSIESTTANLDLNGSVTATDRLSMLAHSDIDAAKALSGTTVSANAASITTHGTVTGNTDLTASGAITADGPITGGDITLESTGADLNINNTIAATDSLTLIAATTINTDSSLSGDRVVLISGNIVTQGGGDISSITGDISLTASGNITLAAALLATDDIIVTSDGTIDTAALTTTSGDVIINANAISVASASAGNDLYFDGTTGVTTTGNLSANSDLTVIGSSLTLGGTVTAGILGQVSLIGTGGSVALADLVTGGDLEITALTSITAVDLTSQAQHIDLQAGTTIALNGSVTSAGNFTAHAGGGISQAGGLTATSQVTLRAAGGDVFQDTTASISAGDDIRIDASGDVYVVSLATTGDDVRIEAGGHTIDADGGSTVLISAPDATLTIHAFSIGNGDDLDVDVARLIASTNGLDGDADLSLDDENDIIIERAETLDGDVSFDAVNITVVGPVTAGDVNGGNNNDVEIDADANLTVSGTVVGDYDAILLAGQDLSISGAVTAGNDLDAIAGRHIANSGHLAAGDDIDIFAQDNVTMTAGQVTAGDHIDVRADYNEASDAAHDGAGSISQTGGIIGSGGEFLFAYADDGILFSTARVRTTQILNGNISLPTGSGDIELHNQNVDLDLIEHAGLLFAVRNAAIGGNVTITSDANIVVGHEVLGLNNIEIDAGQNLTLTNSGVALAHSGTSSVANVTATGAGNIILGAEDALTLGSDTVVNAGSGTIKAEAGVNIILSQLTTVNDSSAAVTVTSHTGSVIGDNTRVDIVADSANAGTTITAAIGIGTVGDFLDTTVDTLSAHVTADGGIWIDENTTVTLADIDTHNGIIVITSDDTMLADDVIAGTSNIVSGNGDVRLTTTSGDITVNTVSAPLDGVLITSAGFIEEEGSDAGADIAGGNIVLVAGEHIGTVANPIEIDALITASAMSGGAVGDDVVLTDIGDDFPVATIDAGDGNVVLLANDLLGGQGGNGSIIDTGRGNTDVTGADVTLTALNGIGVGRQGDKEDLDINADTLTATVINQGDINIDEDDSVEIISATTADGDVAVRAVDSIAIGLIDADQHRDNDVILWAGDNITDAQSDTATDIYAGGLIDLTVDTGYIATAEDIIEVIAGDKLHLTALDNTPRGEFWAVLTGTAGGSDTPRYVSYQGLGDVPPARIFWNGDVIGGQEDQMLTYQETESVFALHRNLVDDIAAFGPTTFLHASLLLDEYYNIRAIDFLHPGFGRVTFPDGTKIIDIQALVDDIVAGPAFPFESAPEPEEAKEEGTEEPEEETDEAEEVEQEAPKAPTPAPTQASYIPASVLK